MGNANIEGLRRVFSTDMKGFRSVPFWSWNNTLDERELVRQIEDMKEAGMGGFIMHARIGLKDEYLGEKWFSCIEACLDKARELDMEAWVKSRKWLWGGIGLQFGVGYSIGFIVNFFGTILSKSAKFDAIWMPIVGWAFVAVFAGILTYLIIKRQRTLKQEYEQKSKNKGAKVGV